MTHWMTAEMYSMRLEFTGIVHTQTYAILVFNVVCSLVHSLSQTQHACLESLTLNRLFQTLHLFVRWAEEGWYDFCSLPFAAKMQMSLPDEDFMRQIPEQYEGI